MSLFAPATLDKFRRFRRQRRAWWSLNLLIAVTLISLVSELFAHGTPWIVRFEGKTYFPRFRKVVPQDLFLNDGVMTPPDWHALRKSEMFAETDGNWMGWAPHPYSPQDTVAPEEIELERILDISRARLQRVAEVRVNGRGAVRPGRGSEWFFPEGEPTLPEEIQHQLNLRFENKAADALEVLDPTGRFRWVVNAYEVRDRTPRTARVLVREKLSAQNKAVVFNLPVGEEGRPDWWGSLPEDVREEAEEALVTAETVPVSPIAYADEDGNQWEVRISKETVQFPFRPIKGHPLGLDGSGRDVLTLILYATRISLMFGFSLVVSVLVLGTLVGGLQGYFGGWVDLFGQRVIEIYSAIPFLYTMIYMGSVFGRSFGLLLGIYAIFNWIGISYYMRAEFLKLRKQPFTEAARSLGLPTGRIMWQHILPNALVPLITFFPFSLVGAISSLSGLDFIGFGLPVGTPSWGDLLSQAQTYPYAWWLILYPSLALFIVILLTVFIGEGLRSAFDPKRETHWEA